MTYTLTWLTSVLRAAGLKVAEVDGWESRGIGDVQDVAGVICHHTAGPRQGNMPSLRTLVQGRPDLTGPLAQLGLGRDGTFYVIAAGRCHHAGKGDSGELVRVVQRKVKEEADGFFGPRTEAAVRAFQRERRLVPDGIVGPKTWAEIDK